MANPANSTAYRLPDGRLAVNVTENKTLAATDMGYVQNVTASTAVVTVPATATLGRWVVRNGGSAISASGPSGARSDGMLVEVDCNAADTFQGLNVSGTSADGKKLQNTAATSRIGDEVEIINVGATDGPIIGTVRGTWGRES